MVHWWQKMTKESSVHRKRLEEIAMDPTSILGFEGPVSKVIIEEEMYNSKNQQIGEIDLLVRTSRGDYYVVEYKATDKSKVRRKAREQLERAADYVYENYGVRPLKLFYVHDDLVVEEIF